MVNDDEYLEAVVHSTLARDGLQNRYLFTRLAVKSFSLWGYDQTIDFAWRAFDLPNYFSIVKDYRFLNYSSILHHSGYVSCCNHLPHRGTTLVGTEYTGMSRNLYASWCNGGINPRDVATPDIM